MQANSLPLKRIMAKVAPPREVRVQHMSARDAKNGFDRLVDLARAAPVSIDKYGRPVARVLSVEEYERLSARSEMNGTNA
jgi:prevent-host-death family protein